MPLDQKFIEELKNKNDLADVVAGYCNLTPRGGGLWACCPLPGHTERTPSFCVNRYGQFFKCFGCGRGGDVITFIMEMESMGYVEAVRLLAEKAGMTMPDTGREDARTANDYKRKEILLAILKDTAKFYVANLRSGKAVPHEEYCARRGLDKKTLTLFGIGASLDYDGLPRYLLSKGYTKEDMLAAGVVSESNGRLSDFEGKRLVFPIINAMGEVVAFGGRVLEKTDFGKYKNTRETQLFVKNRTLYNINRIKKMRSQGQIRELILVEGYMDTVSLVAAGFENVVASMGTSLTKEHAKLLKRYTENVLICYDGDAAGIAANIRGLEILGEEGLNVKVVPLPDGMDPDDVIKKLGPDGYRECLAKALPLLDFKLKILGEKYLDGTDYGKRKYITEALRTIGESRSESEREDLLRAVSKTTGITYQSLRRDMEKSPESQVIEPEKEFMPKHGTRLVQAERYVLARLIAKNPPADAPDPLAVPFSDPMRRDIAAYIADFRKNGREVSPSMLYDYMGEEGREETEAVLFIDTSAFDERYFRDCLNVIERTSLENELEKLKRMADAETDAEAAKQITARIMEIALKLKNLGSKKPKTT